MKGTILLLYFTANLASAHAQVGVPVWTNRYDGPAGGYDSARAIALDSEGNVLVAGISIGSDRDDDFTTIKYSSLGLPLWTNRYSGPENRYDVAVAIAVDAFGRVFVTGYSGYTVSSNGLQDFDYATVAYSSQGQPLWTNRYSGISGGNDDARGIVVDGSGDVFVTGASVGGGSDYDYATIKYSGTGVAIWTNRYNGFGNGSDEAWAIALDDKGNVIVAGSSYGGHDSWGDYATIKYSGGGVPLWTNRYNGFGNSSGRATGIAIDTDGNVIVTGWAASTNYFVDFTTIKYSSVGLPLWTNKYDGSGNNDFATAVALSPSGDAAVAGYSWNGSNNDYVTINYSRAGVPLWTNRFGTTGNSEDNLRGLAVDGWGNVFVTGSSTNAGRGFDYTTIKYSKSGIPLWTNRYDGPGNSDDCPHAIALDENGRVFVTGSSKGNGSYYDYATIVYSNASVLPIPLAFQKLNNQMVLTWTNAAFDLQSASAINGTFSNILNAASPYTNPITGTQQFFRLISN